MPSATFDPQRWEDMLVAVSNELQHAAVKHAAQCVAALYGTSGPPHRYQAIGVVNALAGLYQLDDALAGLRALPPTELLALNAVFQRANSGATQALAAAQPNSDERAEVDRLMKACFGIESPEEPVALPPGLGPDPDHYVGVGGVGPNLFGEVVQQLTAMPADQRAALLVQLRAAFEGLEAPEPAAP